MPGQLGGLVVSLGLDAVDYTQGLTKAERDAQKFAQNITGAFTKIGATLGALGIGAAIFDATKDIISSAAALQDLAGVTGSSVESLSKLSNQAKISGANFNQLQTALEKLAVVIGGVGPQAERAQKAMALLGVTATDPATALNEIAVAFSKYEDGARKAAFAQAIFGKSGPEFLKVLKDIAETQDVAATVTAKQAEEANNLEKQLRTLSVEATTFRDAVLTGVVPALNTMIEDFREGIKLAGGFFKAIVAFGTLSPFDSVVEGLKRVNENIAILEQRKATGGIFAGLFGATDADLEIAKAQKAFLELKQRQEALQLISDSNQDARDLKAKQRAQLPPLPDAGGGGRAAAQRITDAERFLESLKRQLETTEKLTAEEKALNAIQSGRLKGLTPGLEASILSTAREIDQIKALEEARKAHEKAVEEDERAIKKANDERERAINSAKSSLASAQAGNESIREEIAILVGGEDARKAIERHHIDMAIAIKDQLLGQRELNGATKDETDIIRAEIQTLEDRKKLLDSRDLAESLKRDAEALQSFKDQFSNTFADAFADFVNGTKTASQAFKDFAKSIEQQITRMAAQSIGNALFGGKSGGTDIFDVISKLFSATSGSSFGGAGGGGGFGTLASGTDFWRGGPTVVGEQGPEVVNLPRGATVTSNAESKKAFGPTMNFVVNVLPGASTKTAQQAAAMTGISVQRALARNT